MSNFKGKGKGVVLVKFQKKCTNPSKVDCSFFTPFNQVGRPIPTALDRIDSPTPTMPGYMVGQCI